MKLHFIEKKKTIRFLFSGFVFYYICFNHIPVHLIISKLV